MENPLARIVALCGLLALPAPVRAQRVLFEMHGEHVHAGLGQFLNCAGDVDMDGVVDLLMFRRDYSGDLQPRVDLVSGATKEALHSWILDTLPTSERQLDLDSLEDVDGDGTRDIVLALARPAGTTVRVHSGASGGMLYELGFPGTGFSATVQAVGSGDLDGDGHEDLLIALSQLDRVHARSGVDGSVLYVVSTAASSSLATIGDVTGDGIDDWVSGSGCDALAEVRSGADGTLVYSYSEGLADCSGGLFGESVAGIGDVDQDGVPDLAVSQPSWNLGRAWLYSGADGSLIRRLLPVRREDSPGTMAAMDVDGDGVPELIGTEGSFLLSSVAIWEVSGRWETYVEFPYPIDRSPRLVARDQPGDFDGDGFADLLVSSSKGPGGNGNGSVFLLSLQGDCNQNRQLDVTERGIGGMADCNGNSIPDECDIASGFSFDLDQDGIPDECSCPLPSGICWEAAPNSSGLRAEVEPWGIPSVSQDSYDLRVLSGPPLEPGLLIGGTSVVSLPFGDGILCVSPALRLVPFAFDGSGRSLLGVDLDTGPLAVIRPGETWYLQAWFRDTAAGGAGYNFSRGVGQLFCN